MCAGEDGESLMIVVQDERGGDELERWKELTPVRSVRTRSMSGKSYADSLHGSLHRFLTWNAMVSPTMNGW